VELLERAIESGIKVFPNMHTTFKILLTASNSVASCERSFSKLKVIKTYLRSTMTQECLTNLALMSIEKETLNPFDLDEVIDQFAQKKASNAGPTS
jgi:hypothetical protein